MLTYKLAVTPIVPLKKAGKIVLLSMGNHVDGVTE